MTCMLREYYRKVAEPVTSMLCSHRLTVHAFTELASENPQIKLLCILICMQNVSLYLLSGASPATVLLSLTTLAMAPGNGSSTAGM